jgi:hypothetical protein
VTVVRIAEKVSRLTTVVSDTSNAAYTWDEATLRLPSICFVNGKSGEGLDTGYKSANNIVDGRQYERWDVKVSCAAKVAKSIRSLTPRSWYSDGGCVVPVVVSQLSGVSLPFHWKERHLDETSGLLEYFDGEDWLLVVDTSNMQQCFPGLSHPLLNGKDVEFIVQKSRCAGTDIAASLASKSISAGGDGSGGHVRLPTVSSKPICTDSQLRVGCDLLVCACNCFKLATFVCESGVWVEGESRVTQRCGRCGT